MIDFREEAEKVGVLRAAGQLTEAHAGELKGHLIKAFTRFEHVIVDFERVTSVDRACMRILCSARHIATITKKYITLIGSHFDPPAPACPPDCPAPRVGPCIGPCIGMRRDAVICCSAALCPREDGEVTARE